MSYPFDYSLTQLRQRRSEKWSGVPPDVLPLPVAEMDCRLAPAIQEDMQRALDLDDFGYAGDLSGYKEAFADFSSNRWCWRPSVSSILCCGDVGAGVESALKASVQPGEAVIYCPPVYPRFPIWIKHCDAQPLPVPLASDDGFLWKLDLLGIEKALRQGAKAVLLCHPHNPVGRVHNKEELEQLADLAKTYHAVVISDEIHAPLISTERFTPFLSVSSDAQEVGVAVTSASKAWNLAGLKCALTVIGDQNDLQLDRLTEGMVGHLGVLAGQAAFSRGEEWLTQLLKALDENLGFFGRLVTHHLPMARWRRPDFGYLAWLDLRPYGLGDRPAQRLLNEGRVEFSEGTHFGTGGQGHVRINLGCSPEVIELAVVRIAQVVDR